MQIFRAEARYLSDKFEIFLQKSPVKFIFVLKKRKICFRVMNLTFFDELNVLFICGNF